MKSPMLRNALLGFSLLGAPLVLAACEEQGPAEQTGEAVDNAVEDAGEQLEDAGEEVEDRAEQ
ncbi:hypothetical protein [Indioceanicola profundi]|uniref:hypothetical protein n=1 Tax=Indioceanicola profundi TaxID=2220096 RepID=UPI000E6AD160|nr:hypothetical protein [Indioceanicola profundi]